MAANPPAPCNADARTSTQPPAAAATGEPDALAFTYPHVNDLWTSDVMHGPRLLVPGRRDAGKTYLHAFLDDTSRMVASSARRPSIVAVTSRITSSSMPSAL